MQKFMANNCCISIVTADQRKSNLRAPLKNSNFCSSARKYRSENHSLHAVNEGLGTELTRPSDEKYIFRDALKLDVP